jgi:signal transduction histidine kinase
VLTRRLALKLLAPTVLVSLALVVACILGLLYLNDLHVNASDVLSENEKSTRAAMRLETAAADLFKLLSNRPEPGSADQVVTQDQEIHQRLDDARDLANWEGERELVRQITQGLEEFDRELPKLQPGAGEAATGFQDRYHQHSLRLADILREKVLDPCTALHKYNAEQIKESDRENRRIVTTLKWGLLALGLGAPLSGLLLGFAVARSLHHSIYQLSVHIRDAAGRLNRELGSVTVAEQGDLPDLHRQMQGVIEEIGRVVDQLQQREREVLRAEQLAAVGQVAAGVAHELRNPLTSVKMLVQTGLEGSPAAGLPPEDLAIIEHEVRRMEQCIRLFLDFARPPRSEKRRTDLAEVVRRALALVEGRAHRQKVSLAADLPAQPVFLHTDPEQIHQVLVNLLLNALDALPGGGAVRVSVARTAGPVANGHGFLVSANGAGWVEVRVRDTGPGIAPPIRARLFVPFVSSKDTGLGLGLSICKRLVEANGGLIRGSNAPGGGALFVFVLPGSESAREMENYQLKIDN